jgi:hypothetical protein
MLAQKPLFSGLLSVLSHQCGIAHHALCRALSSLPVPCVLPAPLEGEGQRVLLCEDSQDNAFLVRAYLKDLPYELQWAPR